VISCCAGSRTIRHLLTRMCLLHLQKSICLRQSDRDCSVLRRNLVLPIRLDLGQEDGSQSQLSPSPASDRLKRQVFCDCKPLECSTRAEIARTPRSRVCEHTRASLRVSCCCTVAACGGAVRMQDAGGDAAAKGVHQPAAATADAAEAHSVSVSPRVTAADKTSWQMICASHGGWHALHA
jgi:hypothetical protein